MSVRTLVRMLGRRWSSSPVTAFMKRTSDIVEEPRQWDSEIQFWFCPCCVFCLSQDGELWSYCWAQQFHEHVFMRQTYTSSCTNSPAYGTPHMFITVTAFMKRTRDIVEEPRQWNSEIRLWFCPCCVFCLSQDGDVWLYSQRKMAHHLAAHYCNRCCCAIVEN